MNPWYPTSVQSVSAILPLSSVTTFWSIIPDLFNFVVPDLFFLNNLYLFMAVLGLLSFFFGEGVSSKRSYRSSLNHSTSPSSVLLVGAYTWITIILNGLPWKRTDLSFLRLHPNAAFQTLLLTMMATPFLLRDSCPQ